MKKKIAYFGERLSNTGRTFIKERRESRSEILPVQKILNGNYAAFVLSIQ